MLFTVFILGQTVCWFFPLRNGVMSGLSLATVIMEAGETSGALKQADFAFKQGRQIIIPENVLSIPKITWAQKYVKNGAAVVKSPMDVLKVLADNNIFKMKKKNRNSAADIGRLFRRNSENYEEKIAGR